MGFLGTHLVPWEPAMSVHAGGPFLQAILTAHRAFLGLQKIHGPPLSEPQSDRFTRRAFAGHPCFHVFAWFPSIYGSSFLFASIFVHKLIVANVSSWFESISIIQYFISLRPAHLCDNVRIRFLWNSLDRKSFDRKV